MEFESGSKIKIESQYVSSFLSVSSRSRSRSLIRFVFEAMRSTFTACVRAEKNMLVL